MLINLCHLIYSLAVTNMIIVMTPAESAATVATKNSKSA
jgi:hypothetical protein